MSVLPRVRVSDNGRFLVTEGGAPFFWLGDTAWELFHRLTRDEALDYFANRQAKRFNVIQAVALAEEDGLNTPNRGGARPLIDNDPATPNDAYFDFVETLIRDAAAHELYIGFLPTWGDKVTPMWGVGPAVFTPENAEIYGRYLGRRFGASTNVIWILGGDRPSVTEGNDMRPVWRAMAAGIDAGAGFRTFKTYHPKGGMSTSQELHKEAWLDMNMMQSGHGSGRDTPVWTMIDHDYRLEPVKPTLDGEPNYEDHPVNRWPVFDAANGYFRDDDVRRQSYRSVFAGGCGVTYGHHVIWQMVDETRPVKNNGFEFMTWRQAMDRPGAGQMQHLRALMESRPYLRRIPDQELIAFGQGTGRHHARATRDSSGSYAFVYIPDGRPLAVDLTRLRGSAVKVWWYDPRTGHATSDGVRGRGAPVRLFAPPTAQDWVLVLDDADRGFFAPGFTR